MQDSPLGFHQPDPAPDAFDADVPRQRDGDSALSAHRSAGKHADPRGSASALSRRQALVVVGAGLTAAGVVEPLRARAIDKASSLQPEPAVVVGQDAVAHDAGPGHTPSRAPSSGTVAPA